MASSYRFLAILSVPWIAALLLGISPIIDGVRIQPAFSPASCSRGSPATRRIPSLRASSTSSSSETDPMIAYEQAREIYDKPSVINGKQKEDEESGTDARQETTEVAAQTNLKPNTTSANATSTEKQDIGEEDSKAPDLYEILGASPEDSKEELKRKYVALAKQTHPDALNNNNNNGETVDRDFSEIAAAYKILSNPKERKRYDRKVKAEAFSRELSAFAGDVAEKAAPQVRDMLDAVAMPFLRRTTATTLASIQAAAREMESNNKTKEESPDLGGVFLSAMKAAQKAGRIVDNLELMEKSEALESQVLGQIEEANKIKAELDQTTLRRVMVAFRTPNATFCASDAAQVLQAWNISETFLERAKLKSTVDRKIQDLQTAEDVMSQKDTELEAAMMFVEDEERNLQQARADRVLALQAEKRAREALVLAQRQVAESKSRLINTTKSLSQAEVAMEKIATDRERMSNLLARQQEDVRKSLLGRKEASYAIKEDENEDDQTSLTELEDQEAALIKEYSRLEDAASQLQSRANKLRDRAEQLKGMQ